MESLAWEPGSPLYTLIISAAAAAAAGSGPAAAPHPPAAAAGPSSSGPASISGPTSRSHPSPDRTPPRSSAQQEVADMMQGVIAATVCDALSQDDGGSEASLSQGATASLPQGTEEGALARPPAHVGVPSPKRSHDSATSSSSVLCNGLSSPSPMKKCEANLFVPAAR